MRAFIFSLCGLLIQAHMPAAIPSTNAPESTHFANFDLGYRIRFPANWTVKRNFMGADVFAAAPADKHDPLLGSRANISIFSNPIDKTVTLDALLTESKDKLKAKYPELKIIETGKVYLDNWEGRKLAYMISAESGLTLRLTNYFIITEGNATFITFGADKEVAYNHSYTDAFDIALKSFKIIE